MMLERGKVDRGRGFGWLVSGTSYPANGSPHSSKICQLFYLATPSGLKIWSRDRVMGKLMTAASWLLLSSGITSAVFLVLLPFNLWHLYHCSTKVHPSWHGRIKIVFDHEEALSLNERF